MDLLHRAHLELFRTTKAPAQNIMPLQNSTDEPFKSGSRWRETTNTSTRFLVGLAGMAVLMAATFLTGCATPAQTAGLAVAGTTLVGAQTPSDELEQIYYLGVFDPVEQLPPTIYRVTVRGQSSFLNLSKFASGWVPAPLIDSLSARVSDPSSGETRFSLSEDAKDNEVKLKTGRKLMLFGPEGMRRAPEDHRLVIVMGADPAKYFEAVDLALGDMGGATVERGNQAALKRLTDAYSAATQQDRRLESFMTESRKRLTP